MNSKFIFNSVTSIELTLPQKNKQNGDSNFLAYSMSNLKGSHCADILILPFKCAGGNKMSPLLKIDRYLYLRNKLILNNFLYYYYY